MASRPTVAMARPGRPSRVAAFSAPVSGSQSLPTARCGSATSAGAILTVIGAFQPRMGNGSMSRFTLTGMPVSPPDAYQGGPVRAQGLASDADGNIWISSYDNNSLYVFLHGNPHHPVSFQQYEGSGPFDVALAPDGTAWVSNSGGLPFGENPRSVAKYALVNGVLERRFLRRLGQQLRGLSVDSHGNAWVASQGNGMVYA